MILPLLACTMFIVYWFVIYPKYTVDALTFKGNLPLWVSLIVWLYLLGTFGFIIALIKLVIGA